MGEITFQPVRLPPTAETLAPGHSSGGPLQSHSHSQETTFGLFVLFVGDNAVVSVQRCFGSSLSYTVSTSCGLPVRFYSRREHLHVRVRCHQIVYNLSIWDL